MTRTPGRTLIIGCGDLGTRVGRLLVARGGTVLGARRHPDALPTEFERVRCDVADDRDWDRLAAIEPDAIVYAVAAEDGSESAYRRAYLDGAEALRRTFDRPLSILSRVVFVSSSAVFGEDDGAWVDEDTTTVSRDHRSRVMLEAERVIDSSPLPATRLRLAGIYGPGRTRLIDLVRARGAPLATETPPVWTNRIHVDDAASAVVTLLERDAVEPVYLGVDDEPSPREVVLRFIAEHLDAAPGLDLATLPRRGSKRCLNDRLRATGWAPKYRDFRRGYLELLR